MVFGEYKRRYKRYPTRIVNAMSGQAFPFCMFRVEFIVMCLYCYFGGIIKPSFVFSNVQILIPLPFLEVLIVMNRMICHFFCKYSILFRVRWVLSNRIVGRPTYPNR